MENAAHEANVIPFGLPQLISHERQAVKKWVWDLCRALDTNPTVLAKTANVAPSTLSRFLEDDPESKKNLSANTIQKLQKAAIDLNKARIRPTLQSGSGRHERRGQENINELTPVANYISTQAEVVAHVRAGEWQAAEMWPEEDRRVMTVPVESQWKDFQAQLLEVRGPSMNMVYPEGSLLICVSLEEIGRWPRHNERVIVHRYNGAGEVEATVKQYKIDDDGQIWLWPRSTDPEYKHPQLLGLPTEALTDEETRIVMLVVGSVHPEHIIPND